MAAGLPNTNCKAVDTYCAVDGSEDQRMLTDCKACRLCDRLHAVSDLALRNIAESLHCIAHTSAEVPQDEPLHSITFETSYCSRGRAGQGRAGQGI